MIAVRRPGRFCVRGIRRKGLGGTLVFYDPKTREWKEQPSEDCYFDIAFDAHKEQKRLELCGMNVDQMSIEDHRAGDN